MSQNLPLFDCDLFIHMQTEKAVLASDDGNRRTAQWLPLSQIEMEPTKTKEVFSVTMPEWLAKEKGFI